MTNTSDATRSRMMASIRGKNTQPELRVRKLLHAAGFRFRLHRKELPGKPDIVLARYKLAIFVHGCFWHRHPSCAYTTVPKTNAKFWIDKFQANQSRDKANLDRLHELGWRTLVIWECAIKNQSNLESELRRAVKSRSPKNQIPISPRKVARS